jgi:hypothetical protein
MSFLISMCLRSMLLFHFLQLFNDKVRYCGQPLARQSMDTAAPLPGLHSELCRGHKCR